MIKWLNNYFVDRKIRVRVYGYLSESQDVEAGVPQGAVCSPLLFNIMLSDMPTDNDIQQHIYVDEVTIVSSGANETEAPEKLQRYLNEFLYWTESWGMVANQIKFYMQMFTRKKIACPIIRLTNNVVECKKERSC